MKLLKVSIVVITYNEEKNIRDCLDSLIKINYPKSNYEIMVVDTSKDATPEIVKTYKGVKLFRPRKKGFANQRNEGLNKSKYDYIAFTDADCIVPSNCLKILVQNIGDNAGIGGNAYHPPTSPWFGKMVACLGTPAGGAIGLEYFFKGKVNMIVTCNALFKKCALEKINGFDNKLKYGGEDTDISRKLVEAGYTLKHHPKSYVYHKTRNSFKEFLRWNFLRGKSNYFVNRSSIFKLFLFSPVSFIFFVVLMFFIVPSWKTSLLLILFVIWFFSFGVFAFAYRRPMKGLFNRKKQIPISLFYISGSCDFLWRCMQEWEQCT